MVDKRGAIWYNRTDALKIRRYSPTIPTLPYCPTMLVNFFTWDKRKMGGSLPSFLISFLCSFLRWTQSKRLNPLTVFLLSLIICTFHLPLFLYLDYTTIFFISQQLFKLFLRRRCVPVRAKPYESIIFGRACQAIFSKRKIKFLLAFLSHLWYTIRAVRKGTKKERWKKLKKLLTVGARYGILIL